MNLRLATTDDIKSIVTFMESLDAIDPHFNCWHGHRPNATHVEFWLREPQAIAIAENAGIIGFDLFNLETGHSNITVVAREDFITVVPALMRFEQSLTGKVPWGPVTSVPLLELYVANGFAEDPETGFIHWVGP